MSEGLSLFVVIVGFIGLGMALNHIGGSIYWAWMDWKARQKKDD